MKDRQSKKDEAWELLQKQVQEHANTIEQYVKVPLNQNQYDALASFQYNLGCHILKNSALLKYLNARQWDKAGNEMLLYCNAGGKRLQ
ncbi:lysozyme [Bacillus sp. RS11]|uniref:lysozyme n=1 Tax=Lysinibacillus sp. RS11 TaxID=3242682 RepID=UPI0035C6EAA0